MRNLPAGLAASLASGAATLCYCWRLIRRDGVALGFTDHDRDLVFDGTTFEAESGLSASQWAKSLGLAVDTIDAQGALSSDALTEDDLSKGLWDDAAVEICAVDWSNTENRVVIFTGSVGQVSRSRLAFRAELRGLAHYLNQQVGRVYARPCDAVLGDGRCKVDLDGPAFKGTGTVSAVSDNRLLTVDGLNGHESGWFAGGRFEWATGTNAALLSEVLVHRVSGGAVQLALIEKAARPIVVGDAFTVRAGCDKSFVTCRGKFDNVVNHRGYPHMPGNDVIFSYVVGEKSHDGGSFFN